MVKILIGARVFDTQLRTFYCNNANNSGGVL